MNRRRKGLIRSGRGAFAVLVLGIGVATPAAAQQTCAPRSVLVERMAAEYGETRQSMGLGGNDQMVEVFASEATGTWTIIISTAAGVSCVVASGQAFTLFSDALPAPGDDL